MPMPGGLTCERCKTKPPKRADALLDDGEGMPQLLCLTHVLEAGRQRLHDLREVDIRRVVFDQLVWSWE